jgi:hypothetical protein
MASGAYFMTFHDFLLNSLKIRKAAEKGFSSSGLEGFVFYKVISKTNAC